MSILIEDSQNHIHNDCIHGDECSHSHCDDEDECCHLRDKTHKNTDKDSKCDISNCADKTHNHSKDEEKERKTCSKCKISLLLEMFRFYRKKYTKMCIKCLDHDKKIQKNNQCEHGRQKSRCKECGGSGICKHGRRKSECKKCGGSQICEHDRIKSQCKECGGSGICKHGRRKSDCKECGGSSICEHGKHKSTCKECGGSGICKHGKYISTCKKCSGSSICEHDKQRSQCIICHPEKACKNCKYVLVKKKYRFRPYCFQCYCVLNPDADIPRKFMIKENYLRKELKEYFSDNELVFNKIIDDGCSQRRPDVRIELFSHSIIIENDEEQHKNTSCENKRTMELFAALGNRPLVMIRFNPDKYTKHGVKIQGCFKDNKTGSLSINKKEWDKRISALMAEIDYHIYNIPEKEITIEYMYYDD